MPKIYFIIASISGLTAVLLGAFAAHGLRDKLSPALYQAFQTGVSYQFYHTFALIAVALLLLHSNLLSQGTRWFDSAAWLFIAGILLFSGSLYLLAMTGMKWLGPVTPLGGVCFIAAWLCLLIGVIRQ